MQILMFKFLLEIIVIHMELNLLVQILKVYLGKKTKQFLSNAYFSLIDKSFVILVMNFKYLIQMVKIP
jgi:hypothetical protein